MNNLYKIGISTCNMGTGNIETGHAFFKDCAENNIDYVEISEIDFRTPEFFDNMKKLSTEYGVKLWSYHIPYFPTDRIDETNADIRKETVYRLSELIKYAGSIGIDKYVLHASSEPINDNDRDEHFKCSVDSISYLADTAEAAGGVICVEDLPRTCLGHSAEEMQKLIQGDSRLKVCFDTNHIISEKPEEVISKLGNKIVTLHVSDFDFIDEKHWLPGEGNINWQNVIAALKDINYSGVWMYEMGFKAYDTHPRSRELTAADFYRNAIEAFNGKEFTKII